MSERIFYNLGLYKGYAVYSLSASLLNRLLLPQFRLSTFQPLSRFLICPCGCRRQARAAIFKLRWCCPFLLALFLLLFQLPLSRKCLEANSDFLLSPNRIRAHYMLWGFTCSSPFRLFTYVWSEDVARYDFRRPLSLPFTIRVFKFQHRISTRSSLTQCSLAW